MSHPLLVSVVDHQTAHHKFRFHGIHRNSRRCWYARQIIGLQLLQARIQRRRPLPRDLRCIVCEKFTSRRNLSLVVATPVPLLGSIPPYDLGKLLRSQFVEILDRRRGRCGNVVQVRGLDCRPRRVLEEPRCDLCIWSAKKTCSVIGITAASYQLQPIISTQVVVAQLDAPSEPFERFSQVFLGSFISGSCSRSCHVLHLADSCVHLDDLSARTSS